MKGKRDPDCDWDPMLGLAILQARTALYERLFGEHGIETHRMFWRSHEAIGAFMGLSDVAVQHIERKALRKLRIIFIYRRHQLSEELQDALEGYKHGDKALPTY